MTDYADINETLSSGGILLLPTETVYGLACVATDTAAVDKIYAVKGRDFEKPLAVCVKDLAEAETLGLLDEAARQLAIRYWPGSLTLVVKVHPEITLDPRCLSGRGQDATIALRCPEADWRDGLNGPLALTSANRSGQPDCVNYNSAMAEFDGELDGALMSDGPLSGAPSTIISVMRGNLKILRQGTLVITEVSS